MNWGVGRSGACRGEWYLVEICWRAAIEGMGMGRGGVWVEGGNRE